MTEQVFTYLDLEIVPEWREYYVNFSGISLIIDSMDIFDERLKPGSATFHQPFSIEDNWFIDTLSALFIHEMKSELFKVNWFFKYQYNRRLKVTLVKLQRNLDSFGRMQANATRDRASRLRIRERRILLRNAFKTHFKEVYLIHSFLTSNLEIFSTLITEYRGKFSMHDRYNAEAVRKFNLLLRHSFMFSKELEANNALHFMRVAYSQHIANEGPAQIKANLDRFAKGNQFQPKDLMLTSFLSGGFLILFIVSIFLLSFLGFFSDNDTPFVTKLFPMFRGSLIMFLYVLFIGIVIYIWERKSINYRRIFGIQLSYSTSAEIVTRACVFLLIWGFIFIYALESFYEERDSVFLDYKAAASLACCVNFLFLLYMFWPIPGMFNSSGRFWLFKVCWNILLSPIKRPAFVVVWVTDQFSSLPLFFRDLAYTICFFSYFVQFGDNFDSVKCSTAVPYLVFDIFFSLVSIVFRVLQCLNLAYHSKDPEDRKFLLLNALKFMMLINSNVWAFVMRFTSWAEYVWWGSVVVSTACFYVWDILRDFCLFQKGSKNYPLRDNMAYPKWFYYFAAIANLFLRCAWVIQMTPISMFNTPVEKNLITTISGIIESFRRCLWNMMKIEVEHLKLVGSFAAIQNVPWPEDFPELDKDPVPRAEIEAEFDKLVHRLKYVDEDAHKMEMPSGKSELDTSRLNYSADEAKILGIRMQYKERLVCLEEKILNEREVHQRKQIVEEAPAEPVNEGALKRSAAFRFQSYADLLKDDEDSEEEEEKEEESILDENNMKPQPKENQMVPNDADRFATNLPIDAAKAAGPQPNPSATPQTHSHQNSQTQRHQVEPVPHRPSDTLAVPQASSQSIQSDPLVQQIIDKLDQNMAEETKKMNPAAMHWSIVNIPVIANEKLPKSQNELIKRQSGQAPSRDLSPTSRRVSNPNTVKEKKNGVSLEDAPLLRQAQAAQFEPVSPIHGARNPQSASPDRPDPISLLPSGDQRADAQQIDPSARRVSANRRPTNSINDPEKERRRKNRASFAEFVNNFNRQKTINEALMLPIAGDIARPRELEELRTKTVNLATPVLPITPYVATENLRFADNPGLLPSNPDTEKRLKDLEKLKKAYQAKKK